MIKTDCFAFRPNPNRCSALNDLYCKYEECHFYKSGGAALAAKPQTVDRSAKLTPEEVAFIRNHYIPRDPNYGIIGLAKKFNMSKQGIQAILSGVTWREEDHPGV